MLEIILVQGFRMSTTHFPNGYLSYVRSFTDQMFSIMRQ